VGGVTRAFALIDTLYDYTLAGERRAFEPLEMDLVMRDTLANLDNLIRQSGARVTYGGLPAVSGDAPQLIQLLQNSIGNGIKYCKAAIPGIQVAASLQSPNHWLFTVKDNGIGIPETQYREIFKPFKRLHGAGEYEGTGLGLATSKKIVERHEGTIWCESQEGQGTTFFFTLRGA
jgi:light-regulated signal transduction histidine kinase (bacteriophytochrome)